MTQDEIIEMAQECNLIGMRPHLDGIYSESLVTFAHLVATKEREACEQRTFVGLTDEQIDACWNKDLWKEKQPHHIFAKAIEAKLKEKNT